MKITNLLIVFIIGLNLSCDSFSDGKRCNGLSLDKQSIIIGDSQLAFLRLSCENFQVHLGNLVGKNFMDFSANGAFILKGIQHGIGLLGEIPAQYDKAKEIIGVPELVIFNGGMNDVHGEYLISSKCKDGLSTECKNRIDDVQIGIKNLIGKMKNDGVKKIIYIGYFYGKDFDNEVYDYFLNPIKHDMCPAENVVFIDLRDVFLGHEEEYVLSNGHASDSGSRIMAELVYGALD